MQSSEVVCVNAGLAGYSCGVSTGQATELQIVDTLNANPQQSAGQNETQTLDYLLKRLPLSYQLVDMNRSRARRYTEQADYRQLALAGIPPAQQAAALHFWQQAITTIP